VLEKEAAGLAARHAADSEIDTLQHLVEAEASIAPLSRPSPGATKSARAKPPEFTSSRP